MTKYILLTVLATILSISSGSAGSLHKVSYVKGGKKITHTIALGGLLSGGMIVAYSEKKDKFLTISYKYKDGRPKPEVKFWDSKSSRYIELFRYKETGELLMSIQTASDIKSLPNVTKLKVIQTGNID